MVNADFEIRRSLLVGETADVYLQRTLTILRNEGVNPTVALEFSPRRAGIFCGITEVRGLLSRVLPESGSEVWALGEGDPIDAGEVALRVKAPYSSVGLYETAISGILAQSTGYASAARECVDAANMCSTKSPSLVTAPRRPLPPRRCWRYRLSGVRLT